MSRVSLRDNNNLIDVDKSIPSKKDPEYLFNKQKILAVIEEHSLEALWDYFLKNQVDLYFDQEKALFFREDWWQQTHAVLEIGSGNGEYLSRIARLCSYKTYFGMERDSELVQKSQIRFQDEDVTFIQGDAEIFNESLVGNYDAIIFRFILQHLQKPMLALNHAYHYLKLRGYILIIDPWDSFRKTSHPFPFFEGIIRAVNEKKKQLALGSRLITSEILNSILSDKELAELFEIAFTNIDECGNPHVDVDQPIAYLTEKEKILYFNHFLYLFEILKRDPLKIPIDSPRAYDELCNFLENEEVWIRPSQHVLVLRKKARPLA